MSNQPPITIQGPAEYNPDLIPQPVIVEPGYVTATYTFPDETTPDHESNVATAIGLQKRFDDACVPSARLGLVEAGRHWTTYSRQWDGESTTQVRRLRTVDGQYWVSRELAAAVVIGSALVLNSTLNLPTFIGATERIVYDMQDHTHTIHGQKALVSQGKAKPRAESISIGSQVGHTTIDITAVRKFVQQLHNDMEQGDTITAINVLGTASDEDARYPNSIGQPNATNQKLAEDRLRTGVDDLKTAGLNLPPEKIHGTAREQVLTDKALVKALAEEAARDGYPELETAINRVDDGATLNPQLAKDIQKNFTGAKNRGVTYTAALTHPGKITITYKPTSEKVPDGTTPPDVPAPHFYGFIPLLPIRKRAWREENRPQLGWVGTKHNLYMPKLIREQADKKFIQIYDDGVGADNLPNEHALWHTPKFEYLLREEGRLQDMFRLDLRDHEDKPQTIRTLFVDATPADEQLTIFQDELVRAALLCNGTLAEAVETVIVYPSSSAGTEHNDPSRVALGQLRQLSSNILGSYNPVLKAVELVMPDDWTAEDLRQLFDSFYGPKGILWHELGHAIKRKGETYTARTAKVSGSDRTYVLAVDNRNTEMEDALQGLKPLTPGDPTLQFDVSYRVKDGDGQEATIEDRVVTSSKQLAHADQARIVGSQVLPRPSSLQRPRAGVRRRLADEEFADSVAGLATKGIPFRSAGIEVPKTTLASGARGKFSRWFLPTKVVQSLIEKKAVAEPNVFPLKPVYNTEVTVTHLDPRKDPLIGSQMTRARQAHSRDGRRLVTYLAEVNYAERPNTLEEAK